MSATSARTVALLIVTALLAGCGTAGVPSGAPAPTAADAAQAGAAPAPAPQPPPVSEEREPPAPAGPTGAAPDGTAGAPGATTAAPDGTAGEAPPATQPPGPETAPGSLPEVPEGEPSRLVVHGDRACNLIALTYDAGSGADGAEAILDVLAAHGLKVTFFLTGRWAEQFPDLARRIADEGHEIANHTYSHPDLTTISDEEVLQQIRDGEEAIRTATGKDPRPLFREPYGAFNEHERQLVRRAGYSYSVYWEVDTLDWTFPGVEATTERILRAQSGSIVLMHLNVADSAAATAAAIPVLQERGYAIVPVSRLLQCSGD